MSPTPSDSSETLIRQLAQGLAPVRPAGPSWRDALIACVAEAAWLAGLLVAWFGLRPDAADRLADPSFVLRAVVLAGAGYLSFDSVIKLALPGRPGFAHQRRLAVSLPVFCAVFLGFSAYSWARLNPALVSCQWDERVCAEAVLALSAVPAAALFFRLRRLAPLSGGLCGALAGLAAALLAGAALAFHCTDDSPLHLAVWHFAAPAGVAMALGWLAGRRWLRW